MPAENDPTNSDENEADPRPATPGPPRPGLLARAHAAFLNPANRFVVLFLVFLAALAFFYPKVSLRYSDAVDWMTRTTATLSAAVFEPFSDKVQQKGKMVIFGGFAVEIIEECTGLYEMLIYAAAVLAFPTSLVKKAIGIGMGAPLLYATNVARIAFLLWVGRFHPAIFDFMHLYFWQATLILMITSVWLLWIFKVVRDEGPAHPA